MQNNNNQNQTKKTATHKRTNEQANIANQHHKPSMQANKQTKTNKQTRTQPNLERASVTARASCDRIKAIPVTVERAGT